MRVALAGFALSATLVCVVTGNGSAPWLSVAPTGCNDLRQLIWYEFKLTGR